MYTKSHIKHVHVVSLIYMTLQKHA